jgi:hypothetical protein
MKTERNIIIAALSLAGLLSQSALADKPEWAGKTAVVKVSMRSNRMPGGRITVAAMRN